MTGVDRCRFAQATEHPTFSEAARAIDTSTSSLIRQINRLEHEFGQPLLQREGRYRIMRPTPFGRKVVSSVRRSAPLKRR
jgi:DNA-binding transcriptional LysR family regulator